MAEKESTVAVHWQEKHTGDKRIVHWLVGPMFGYQYLACKPSEGLTASRIGVAGRVSQQTSVTCPGCIEWADAQNPHPQKRIDDYNAAMRMHKNRLIAIDLESKRKRRYRPPRRIQ